MPIMYKLQTNSQYDKLLKVGVILINDYRLIKNDWD